MILKGKAWKFGDNISTDHIVPGRLFHLRSNIEELAKHVMEDARSDFAQLISPGDIIVGGKNFGIGSSREHAPLCIKTVGISAVLAQSFARIFYRNAINVGLLAVICDTSQIDEGDELEIDLEKGTVTDKTKNLVLTFPPLLPAMSAILKDGGLVAHIKKHGGFKLE